MKLFALLSIFIVVANAAIIRDVSYATEQVDILDENGFQCDYSIGGKCTVKDGISKCELSNNGFLNFIPNSLFNGGSFLINMKAEKSEIIIIQGYDDKNIYVNIYYLTPTTKYEDYTIVIPVANEEKPLVKYGIQTSQENTLYIKKITYIPPEDPNKSTPTDNNSTPADETMTHENPTLLAPSETETAPKDPPSSGTSQSSPSSNAPVSDNDSGSTGLTITLFYVILLQIIIMMIIL